MWGPVLFLVTIVMVTSSGREVVLEYFRQTMAQYAAQLPFSDVALGFMALCVLACLLTMRGRRTEKPQAPWVWREFRGEAGEEPPATNREFRV